VTFTGIEFTGTPGPLNEYKLVFSADGFTNVLSNEFSVNPGVPAALVASVTATVNRSGEVMPRQPSFRLVDRFGNLAYDNTGTLVTASIIANDGKGALSGSTTATSLNGLVQFNGLVMSGFPGTGYDVVFAVGGQVASYTEVGLKVYKEATLALTYDNASYVKDATVATSVKTVEDPNGTPVFSSADTSICTVDSSTAVATIKGAGTCEITMSVADNGFWLANSITSSFVIAKADQSALVFNNATSMVFGTKLALDVTQATSGIADLPSTPFIFETVGECREVGTTLFSGDVGSSCLVTVTREGNANFNEQTASINVTVTKANQPALDISSVLALKVGEAVELHAAGGAGTGEVVYDLVTGDEICDVAISASVWRVTALAPGTCSVSAQKAASTNYNASSISQTQVTVTKETQTLRFTSVIPMYPIVEPAPSDDPDAPAPNPNAAFGYEIEAVSNGDATVTYSISADSFDNCLIEGNDITFVGEGDCVVTASAGATDDYLAATSIVQTIKVGYMNQTINFAQLPSAQIGDANVILNATTNAGQTVTFTSSTTNICSIDEDGTLAIKMAGYCKVAANAAAAGSYEVAPTVYNTFKVFASKAGAPFITSISGSNRAVTATFTTPSFNGGAEIVAYQMIATPTLGEAMETSACVPDNSGLNSCTLYGLTNDVAYTVTVAAINEVGVGDLSGASPEFTPAPSLMAVTALIAIPTNDGGFRLNWNEPDALIGTFEQYDVYVKEKNGSYEVQPDASITAGVSTTTITLTASQLPGYVAPVEPEPEVTAQVARVARVATVSYAAPISYSSIGVPTMRMASMRMIGGGSNISPAASTYAPVTRANVTPPVTPAPSSGPAPLEFKVVTVTDIASTESTANTASAIQTPKVVPGAPSRLAAAADEINKLTVSWGAATFDGGATITKYTLTVNNVVVCETVRPNTCVMPTLKYGTTYNVAVTATNSVGTSAASVFSVTTIPDPTPPSSGGGAAPAPVVVPPAPKPTTPPKPAPKPTVAPAPAPAPTSAPTAAPAPAPAPAPVDPAAPEAPAGPTAPGAPVANPAIGATGDDSAPPVPFDPTGSPEAIAAAVETATTAVTVAAAVAAAAAAAAGAAAAAAAAGAAAGAAGTGGTGGGSSSSSSSNSEAGRRPEDFGDGEDSEGEDEPESLDVVQDNLTLVKENWGDRLAMFAIPFITFFDRRSHNAAERIANVSPFFAKLINDGAYLRAMLGTLSFSGPLMAAVIGVIAVNENAAEIAAGQYSEIITPGWQWLLAIAVLGAFDASAGFVGAMTFIIGSIITVGHVPDTGEVRTMMGIMLVSVAPALLTTGFRTIRKQAALTFNAWWERIADFVIAPFMAGWSISAIVSGLPALAGLTLDVANHVTDFVFFIAIAIFVRVALEEFAAFGYPARLNKINPDEIPDPSILQKSIVLLIKYGVWVFIGGALIGPSWQVWVGSALFVFPAVVGWYTDKFPNSPRIWRMLPTGIPGLAFTLIVASATAATVGAVLGEDPALGQWSFLILPIPMLVITALGWFGRHGEIDADGNEEERPGKRNKWIYRIGGVVAMILTLKLAGVI
jgi:hypothetical protein